jgi:dGTPase
LSPLVELEADGLARVACRAERSRGRRRPEPEHPYRSAFQRDRDRVIHSTAFRRLEYKTQVFVNHEGDHYRTRLTHTMEVAQIARTIARALGLNEDLTEAVALAHDIGHTPFGHSGEEALDEIMAGHGGFEHNRHGLRVVDLLEKRYAEFDGLNLTYEVREAFVRHRTAYDEPAAAPEEFPADEQVHLEGQAVSAADAVAYNSHDLDDGLVSGLLRERELRGLAIWRAAAEAISPPEGREAKLRRRAVVRRLIDRQVTDIIEASGRAVAEAGAGSLDDVRGSKDRLIGPSEAMREEMRELQEFLHARLYRHFRVMQMANKAKRFVKELFAEFVAHSEDLPDEHRERARRDGLERVVCDYIAGMTDRFAQEAYRKLFHPYEGM